MPLKGLIFAGLFLLCAVGALVLPCLGVYGYIADYCIGSASQWWEAPFSGLGIRYSLTLALTTAIGMLLQRDKLRFGESFLQRQEVLMLLFLGTVWLSDFLTGQSIGRYITADHPTIKMTKVIVFAFMLSHVITDRKKAQALFWTLVISSLILGMQAYDVPRSAFRQGRLESVGGADFRDANRFAGFMASMLFIVGTQFLRSGWRGRLISFLAGGFTANAVILARSRGALLGLACGIFAAAIMAPKKYRGKILIGLVLATAGVFYLTDPQTVDRTSTITATGEERDSSAQSRLEIWEGGVKMLIANPVFGVGPGNFYQNIGKYVPQHSGRDAHNTFVRCAGELGIIGLSLFVLLAWNAIRILRRCSRELSQLPPDVGKDLLWMNYGCLTGLIAMLAYGMTGTLVYTEYLWWMLTFPVCMQRVLENELADMNLAAQQETEPTKAVESKAETLPNRRSRKDEYTS
jgi:O-antigen ligase